VEVRKAGDTTTAIAAHFRFPAISVIISHPEMRVLGIFQKQDTVGSNGKPALAHVANESRSRFTLRQGGVPVVDYDKIVTRSDHFCKQDIQCGVLEYVAAGGRLAVVRERLSGTRKVLDTIKKSPSETFDVKGTSGVRRLCKTRQLLHFQHCGSQRSSGP